MKEIQYEIVKEIAVLSKGDSGYTKEINLISWNGREPKYDIRSFSPNREKCGKGITLNADEAAALLNMSARRQSQKRLSRLFPRIFGRRLPRATPSTMRGCPLRMYAMEHENR